MTFLWPQRLPTASEVTPGLRTELSDLINPCYHASLTSKWLHYLNATYVRTYGQTSSIDLRGFAAGKNEERIRPSAIPFLPSYDIFSFMGHKSFCSEVLQMVMLCLLTFIQFTTLNFCLTFVDIVEGENEGNAMIIEFKLPLRIRDDVWEFRRSQSQPISPFSHFREMHSESGISGK